MKKTALILSVSVFAAVFTIMFTGGTVYAQQQSSKKKQPDNCITSKCHAGLNKDKFVHGPIAAGECTICHGRAPKHKESPKRNKFGEVKDIAGTCYNCHDKFKTKKFTHTPVEEGDCTACHSPHGSSFKFQLTARGGELCFDCHDEEIVADKYVHGPAAVGGCIACHEAHTADYEKNLKAKGPALCFMCHTDLADDFQKAKIKHKPVVEDCTKCHNPHAASQEFMLSYKTEELCLSCHKKMSEWIEKASVPHGALSIDRSCLNCHEAHVSDIDKNLSKPPLDLCMDCHNREIKRADGKPLPDMVKLLKEKTDHHGPIKQKDCSGCHNTHGSGNFRILREAYPETFYKPFSIYSYNLCFSCHEKTIVQNPETTKLTNFRNGKTNLHFKHVNKPEKGRTCRSCHETHASNHPKHIRDSVPFGTWELPVNFEKTKTGGSCTPGCHKMKKYDRIRKVQNP